MFTSIINTVENCISPTRYKVGQRFGRHIDESADLGGGKVTHYTLLIYLSGGAFKSKTKVDKNAQDSLTEPLVGGETVFYGPRNSLVAEVHLSLSCCCCFIFLL